MPGVAVSVLPTVWVPEMVGTGAVNVPTATAAVAAEVFAAVVNPVFEPVTWTVIALPRSAATNEYVAEVAPVTATPERNH